MNEHLNWHVDEALEFKLTLFNPLMVAINLSKIEVFCKSDREQPLASLQGADIP